MVYRSLENHHENHHKNHLKNHHGTDKSPTHILYSNNMTWILFQVGFCCWVGMPEWANIDNPFFDHLPSWGEGLRGEAKVDSRGRQGTADQCGGGHFRGGLHLKSLLYLHTNIPLCSLWLWAVGALAGINKLLPEVYSQPLLHQRELDKPFFWQLRNSREGADLLTLRKVGVGDVHFS